MATREQWMAQLKKADEAAQAGNEEAKADFMKIKQIILDGDKNGTWGAGAGGAPQAVAEGTDQQGFLQQMFDVRNAQTGESYIYGNKPKPTGFDDIQRIMQDTGSRGLTDKITGGDAAARTDAARERTSDWVEAPADIVSAIATSPYRVAGTLGGAGYGAAEGALNAYGHQDDWVPDTWSEWGDIGKGAGVGAVTGGLGAKTGEWLGKGWNAINPFQKKAPYSTADELYEAAEKAAKRKKPGPQARDTLARAKRMEAAELANVQGRQGFKDLLSGMDKPMTEVEKVFGPDPSRMKWPGGEKRIVNELAHKPTNTAKWLEGAGKVLQGGNLAGSFKLAKAAGSAPAMFGGLLRTLAQVQNDMDPATFKKLQTSILDSTGRLKTDKATENMVRDIFAKTLTQGGETTVTPRITR